MTSSITTPPLRGTPPEEGNSPRLSPPLEGWQAKPDGVVPVLRFPEFRGAEEWELRKLGEVISLEYGRALPENKRKAGTVPVVGSNGIVGYHDEYFVTGPAIVIGRKGSVGQINWISQNCYPIDTTYYVKNKNPESYFLPFLNILIERSNLPNLKDPGAVPGLNRDTVHSVKSFFPKPLEQQKIADCLTSVDELITAQTQKLDALKTHKKGLMQQLFPAEGETVPRLRFPEFRDKGEWSPEKFGEICKFVRGPFGGALKKDIFVKEGYAVYEQSHAIYENFDDFRYYITKEKYDELKRFAVKSNDLIMSCSGTMGKFAVVPSPHKEGVINQALLKLTVKKGFNLNFIKYTLEHPLNQEKLLSQSAGGAIKNVVGVDQLKEIELPIPGLQEQQKIANCLTAIDEMIKAQTQKLDALKTHKKGLMQQLFPSVGGVAGEA